MFKLIILMITLSVIDVQRAIQAGRKFNELRFIWNYLKIFYFISNELINIGTNGRFHSMRYSKGSSSIRFFNDTINLSSNEYDSFVNDVQKTLSQIEQQIRNATNNFRFCTKRENLIESNRKICIQWLNNASALNRSLVGMVENLLKRNENESKSLKTNGQSRCLSCIAFLNRVMSSIPEYVFSITFNLTSMYTVFS